TLAAFRFFFRFRRDIRSCILRNFTRHAIAGASFWIFLGDDLPPQLRGQDLVRPRNCGGELMSKNKLVHFVGQSFTRC
ncbi:MAG: hypothetical protein AN484_28185, partial [Aphanizomenon flos-aquae WA102]